MSAPATCTVSGTLYDATGTAVAGALVRCRVIGTPPVTAGGGNATGESTVTYTDASGAWSLALPQTLTAWLEIPAAGICHTLTVPDEATAALSAITLTEYTP